MPRWTFGILLVAAAFLALGGYKMFMTASTRAEPPAFTATATEGFAADRAPAEPVRFDAKRAMSYLEQICKIGPRMSATEGMKKQQEMLKKHFAALGGRVQFQKFAARQTSRGQEVEMANLIISWYPDRKRRVILCSHYDTRPIADQEENIRKWHEPFVSANDDHTLLCSPSGSFTVHPFQYDKLPYTSGANDLVEGPFLGGYMEIKAPNASATLSGRACALPLGDFPADERRRAYYYTIFPTMMLSLHPDYAVFYTVWPRSASESRVVCEWLVHPDAPRAAGYNIQDAEEFWDRTNRQDWHICERSQLGVSSRMYGPGPYSPRESIPAAWDREYLKAIGG